MADMEEIRAGFARKLEDSRAARGKRLREELDSLQPLPPSIFQPVPAADVAGRIADIKSAAAELKGGRSQVPGFPQALVNLTRSDPLRELDQAFLKIFNLPVYYPAGRLAYPTIYCETLEEFFAPFLAGMNYSAAALAQELERMTAEAREGAGKGGGIFGVNFPGQGCYLNGWLFGALENLPPREVMRSPEAVKNVLGTAAHEKLGHGFLSVYSTLGQLKTELGLSVVQIASRFGLAPADDAADRLRYDQKNLLFTVSQFLEEGWATWIEHFLLEEVIRAGSQNHHSFDRLVEAVQGFPREIQNIERVEQSFLAALGALFSEEELPLDVILRAVVYLEKAGLELDDYFSSAINQPLRYALGKLLFMQAAANLGAGCLPYAALIAANVTFDPARISLADLQNLFFTDPRLNPDARLAAISRLKLEHPGDIRELAGKVNSEFSFSIPPELKV